MLQFTTTRGVALAVLALTASAGTASADISTVVLGITATLDGGAGPSYPLNIEIDPNNVDGNGNYFWELDEAISVTDPISGAEIFQLAGASVTIFADPSVALNFQVLGGFANTVFDIDSAVLGFAPLANSVGRATAAVSVTDLNGDGATLTPGPAGMYSSFYNGRSTTFQHLLGNSVVAAANSTATDNQSVPVAGFQNIGTTLNDIESEWNFTLSAGDLASGTSEFEVIPAPATAVLGLAALAGLRRRR